MSAFHALVCLCWGYLLDTIKMSYCQVQQNVSLQNISAYANSNFMYGSLIFPLLAMVAPSTFAPSRIISKRCQFCLIHFNTWNSAWHKVDTNPSPMQRTQKVTRHFYFKIIMMIFPGKTILVKNVLGSLRAHKGKLSLCFGSLNTRDIPKRTKITEERKWPLCIYLSNLRFWSF